MITPMPNNIKIEDNPNYFTIRRRWFSFIHFFTLFFSLMWNGILLIFYFGILSSFQLAENDMTISPEQILMLFFPVIHVAAGIGIFYYSMCGFFNSTYITATHEFLTVRNGPLPSPGNRKIRIDSIKQFYCEERRGSKGSVSYKVNVITPNFTKINLVSGLYELDQARFIEKAIEDRLGIEDEHVSGEVMK